MAAVGVYYCGLTKTIHKGFLNYVRKFGDWLVGPYLVMKSTPRFTGEWTILTIGYKYNFRKVLGFIAAEGSGSNEPGDPYLSHFPDIFLMFLFAPLFVLTC